MDELTAGLAKIATGLAAVAIFIGLLLIIFFIGARAKGRLQFPAAMVVFLGPAILLLAYGLIAPAFLTTVGSFQNATGQEFVGFANYSWIFTTESNRKVLLNTALWIIIAPLFSTGIGLMLALLLDRMKRESISKSLIFMPMAISFVGAGVIWRFIYYYSPPGEPQIGLLNAIVTGLGGQPQAWTSLVQPWNNLFLVVIMIWLQTGFAMVIFSSAIKGIPTDILEASRVDGATEWQVFTRIMLPSIPGTIITVSTTVIIFTLKIFDVVWVMTGGQYGTQVIATEFYRQYSTYRNFGYGSAIAVVLLIAVVPVMIYNLRQFSEREAF